jgi:lysophospholipid acyltransferase (LPLAT)-like uncharacterized protein
MEKNKIREIYEPARLSAYSFKERLLIRLAAWAFYTLIYLIGKTLRLERESRELFEQVRAEGKTSIYVFWHNRIFPAAYFFRDCGYIVITSRSFDGEYIARFIQRLGYGAVRGSSTRGGVSALVEAVRLVRGGLSMVFTIDGPRGPRYVAKSGACMLAKKTGCPILPFLVETERYWEVKSWDRLQIPKPFSRARFFKGETIFVSPDADEAEIENKRLELQKSLDELVARGQQWRQQKNKT